MFSLAHKSSTSHKVDRSVSCDGYRQCDRAVIVRFQQIIEREPDCDYSALAAALLKARDPQFVVTLVNLRYVYNNSVYAAAEVAYANR